MQRDALHAIQKTHGPDRFGFSECDVRDREQVRDAVREMRAQQFLPDVVILNAGIYRPDVYPSLQEEVCNEVMYTNFFGALHWIFELLPLFLERRRGQFIAISSIVAFRSDERSLAYPASKAALSVAFRSLRARYRSEGIFFKTVFLGPIATGIVPVSPGASTPWYIATPHRAARFIARMARSPREEQYFPFISTLLFRLTMFLPSFLYTALARRLRR